MSRAAMEQVLAALEGGDVMCEVIAAGMLRTELAKRTLLTPTEKFLLHEMRYIAGIGRGPVARVAEHAMTIAQKMHDHGAFTGEGAKP
jgi:hypothetical protein